MMMWGSTSPVPARFIAMMKDYASSFAGKSATTADFRAPSVSETPKIPPCCTLNFPPSVRRRDERRDRLGDAL
jgi:hypothetical protein